MKKLLTLLSVLGTMTLFAGAEIPVNGDFKIINGALYGWTLKDELPNKGASFEVVTHWFSDNELKLTNGVLLSDMFIYNGESFIEMEAKVSGKGMGAVGVNFFDKEKKQLGTFIYNFNLVSQRQKIEQRINAGRFFAQNKITPDQVMFFQVFLGATGQALFEDIEAEFDR